MSVSVCVCSVCVRACVRVRASSTSSLSRHAHRSLAKLLLLIICLLFHSDPDRGARSIVMSMSVCLSVCLSVRDPIMSSELCVRASPNFLCMLPMAVARSSSGGVVNFSDFFEL